MRASNVIHYQFPTWTYVAGSEIPALDWKPVPQVHGKFYLHVTKLIFKIVFTPTYGGGGADFPTIVGMNNVLSKLRISDGAHVKLSGDGGLNLVRLAERVTLGRPRVPDPDVDLASGSARYFRRVWHPGPPQLQGSPGDFLIPVGLMAGNGEVAGTFGTLAQASQGAAGSGVTALTASITPFAELAMLDHLNIPPLYSRTTHAYTGADTSFPMPKSKLESVWLLNSGNFDAWTAGDLGKITADAGTGGGPLVNAPADLLSTAYGDDFVTGEIGTVYGEPAAASDDNHKKINRSSPTALVAGDYDAQAVFTTPPAGRISKMPVVREALRITNDGSQTTAVAVIGRIAPRSTDYLAEMLARVGLTNSKAVSKIDTLSKKDLPPGSDVGLYLPIKVRP